MSQTAMTKTCKFCGQQCTDKRYGKRAYTPHGGYDLCRECWAKWAREGGIEDFLLETGEPKELFRIESASMHVPDADLTGSLVFFDKSIAFLSSARRAHVNPALGAGNWRTGAAIGSAVGFLLLLLLRQLRMGLDDKHLAFYVLVPFLIGGALVATWLSRRRNEPRYTSMEDAIRRSVGLVAIKRGDIKSIRYQAGRGLVIETVCMEYDKIHVPEDAFLASSASIEKYLNGENVMLR